MNWVMGLYGIILSIFGLYITGIGIWGLLKKRPLVFSARQLMWVLFLAYVPGLIQSFLPLFTWRSSTFSSFNWFTVFMPFIQVALMSLLVFIFWRQMTGYLVFGVSDDTFRDALLSALNKLNLPFQERLSKVKLTSLEADLYAVVAEWMGSAQIRIKQPQHTQRVRDIAKAMNDYYATVPVKVNNIAYILYLLLGLLMLLLLIGMAVFMVGFFARYGF